MFEYNEKTFWANVNEDRFTSVSYFTNLRKNVPLLDQKRYSCKNVFFCSNSDAPNDKDPLEMPAAEALKMKNEFQKVSRGVEKTNECKM